ncbi:MAG: hypothetical protein FD139_853 [Methylocystaceae bacterium]|nr:MAG: hypothetical protein FD148_1884 [Methylocystaceae bacterium]KAF0209607.1 MAG: hypothetical protein FD172_3324 [Methylocystaceae bacterium]TXT46674.1 MAG: hypothetical protein FD139_853 [Methylocystaceae bacterium]
MTEADGTSGKRGVKPPPIISNAPEGFAGAPPGSTDDEQRQALYLGYLAIWVPLAVAFVLFIVVQWIEQSRCARTDASNETACSSDSSGSSGHGGGSGGSGGGGEGAARFGGFGAFGAGHGGGG